MGGGERMCKGMIRKAKMCHPGQVAELVEALSCSSKGCGFNPWLECIWEANDQCFSLSLSN